MILGKNGKTNQNKMTEEEKDIRIKELEEFLEEVIEHPYMCGSSIWEEGWELLNKNKDEQKI